MTSVGAIGFSDGLGIEKNKLRKMCVRDLAGPAVSCCPREELSLSEFEDNGGDSDSWVGFDSFVWFWATSVSPVVSTSVPYVARTGISTKIALLIASFDEQLLLLEFIAIGKGLAATPVCFAASSGDGFNEPG